MPRLFFALELSAELRAELSHLQSRGERRLAGRMRLSAPEQLHLTLRFLGEVSEPAAGFLMMSLPAALLSSAPFELELAGSGCFPPTGTPRVWWAGLANSTALEKLVEQLETLVRRAGLPAPDHPFSPHITLARLAGAPGIEALRSTLEGLTPRPLHQRVEQVNLMESQRGPAGSVYLTRAEGPLRGSSA